MNNSNPQGRQQKSYNELIREWLYLEMLHFDMATCIDISRMYQSQKTEEDDHLSGINYNFNKP